MEGYTNRIVAFLLLVAIVGVCTIQVRSEEAGGLVVKETVICPFDEQSIDLGTVTISPDHRHIAFVMKKGADSLVVIDGKEGKRYEKVSKPIFSPDGLKCAYFAIDKKNSFVVENTKTGTKYDSVVANSLLFSPDSKSLAYAAEKDGKRCVVLGGKEQKFYKDVAEIHFSEDGKHLSYLVTEYVPSSVFPTTGMDGDFYVVDGKEYSNFGKCSNFCMSANGKRVAFITMPKLGEYIDKDMIGMGVTIDGEVLEILAATGMKKSDAPAAVFSPDGKRVAYCGQFKKSEKFEAVIDGKRYGPYRAVFDPVFSPSGKKVVYLAIGTDGLSLCVNGKSWEFSEEIDDNPFINFVTFAFSKSDSIAYRSLKDKDGFCIIENDKAMKAYKWVSPPVYNVKGELCFLANDETNVFLVRAGKEETPIEGKPAMTGVLALRCPAAFNVTGDQYAYVIKRDGESRVILNGGISEPIGEVQMALAPEFSTCFGEKSLGTLRTPPGMDPDKMKNTDTVDGSRVRTQLAFNQGNVVNLIVKKDGKFVLLEIKGK